MSDSRAPDQQGNVSDLRQHGTRLLATVAHIEMVPRPARYLYGPSPWPIVEKAYWVVVAYWTEPLIGNRYIFLSEEQSSYPGYVPGDKVPVWVDPADYHRYAMEM